MTEHPIPMNSVNINPIAGKLDLVKSATWLDGRYINSDAFTEGSILFRGATNIIEDNTNLFWDNTNKRVGIGTASPEEKLHIKDNVNDATRFIVENSSLDTGASAQFSLANGTSFGSDVVRLIALGKNYATNGAYIADGGVISAETNMSGGLSIMARNVDGVIRFYTGGYQSSYERMRIDKSGKVGIGTDSPDTKLQVVGDTKLGDDNTNYASFATDGELTLTGTARVYKNLWINVQGLKAPGTKPATAVDWGISGGWEFSNGTDDTVFSSIRLPQDMDRTVAPEFKIGFASDTNTGNVVWQIEYLYLTPNEDTTASAQETLTTTTTISGTTDGLTIATITGMDLPSATDQLLKLRIKRLGADASDTLADDCVLIGCGLKYVSDKLGGAL